MQLPQYYAVKIDNYHPEWYRVIEHFNQLCINTNESKWDDEDLSCWTYIGYDGNVYKDSGTDVTDYLVDFENADEVTVFTVDEFINMLDNKSVDNYDIF